MKRLLFIILCFVLATACVRKDKGFVPEHLLSEQEMIDVMTDIQIIEADINYQKSQERDRIAELEQRRIDGDTVVIMQKDFIAITRDCYEQLLAHYGITDSILTDNVRYYTERPVILERMMDSVINRLTSSIPPQ